MKKVTILSIMTLFIASCADVQPIPETTLSESTTSETPSGINSSISKNKDNTTFRISDIPKSIEEFLSLRAEIATSPQGGAALFVVAMIMYTRDKNLGLPAFTIVLKKDLLSKGDIYKGYQPPTSLNFHLQNLLRKPYIARSYINEAQRNNRYKLPKPPYTLTIQGEMFSKYLENEANKVFVRSLGADSPRPVQLKKNDKGYWKVTNYNSLFLGVPFPEAENDEL